MTHDWIKNTGTVPEGVGPDTLIEVEYGDGAVIRWAGGGDNDMSAYWVKSLRPDLDIVRWRFV